MIGTVSSCVRQVAALSLRSLASHRSRQWQTSLVQIRPRSHGFRSSTVKARADGDGESLTAPPAQETVAPRKVVRRTSPPVARAESVTELTSPLKTVAVEEEGVSREGVAKVEVDRERNPDVTNWGRIAALAGGDIAALLLFSAVGRQSHGMSLDWEVVSTADPFIAGWLLGAYIVGGYGAEGQGQRGLPAASLSAVKSWAVGVPLALAIRTYTTGHAPAQPFIIVSLASTLLLVTGWRAAFTAVFPNDDKTRAGKQGDKKGSLLELFELLGSLVRRW